ncbi:MAG: hypothetical protein EBZ48_16300, partial [Proteobacteria bacterium]|nr:hypothetical protein [Pseudomonadota bacterium]
SPLQENYTYGLALGDVNGDGISDIVTAERSPQNRAQASVQIGRGDGTFVRQVTYSMEGGASGSYSQALGLRDLNDDGFLDIVTAGWDGSTGRTTVRLGRGDGSFGTPVSYATEGSASTAVTVGDLNGDGILDLVTAGSDPASGQATVRLGRGDGSFGTAVSYATEAFGSSAATLGDLNGDGFLDLVTVGTASDGRSTIRLGRGDGSFGSAVSYSIANSYGSSVVLGDLNSDGLLDLIATGTNDGLGGQVSIRLGQGNGSFGTQVTYAIDGELLNAFRPITIGDLNGDGFLDLVIGGVSTRLGTGNGSFGSAVTYSTLDSSAIRTLSLAVGDLNGDGVLDIVTGGDSYDGNFGSIFLGRTQDGLGPMLEFSLKTKADALQAMGMLDRTLSNLAKQRGVIGASQTRVNTAISNLQTARENFAAAEGRIRDVDMASEVANLTR